MTDLNELVGAYKREVAPLGGFAAAFPNATDADIRGALADGFSQAQLEGFFKTVVLDVDAQDLTPDISSGAAQLIVIYAGMRAVRTQMLQVKSTRYKAGPVEADVTYMASVLVELLRDLRARRDALLELARRGAVGQTDFVYDGYAARALAYGAYGGGAYGGPSSELYGIV